MLAVTEKFVSINGEGAHAGELAAFIRFRGCNLQCSYCDTRWSNCRTARADMMRVQQLTEWVSHTGVRNVTLTGGEPLLQEDIGSLIQSLMQGGYRVEIETNGSVPVAPFIRSAYRPVLTMDYKLPGSGMESHMCTENFACLGEHDTVKFVAGSYEDLLRAKEIIEQFALAQKCHLYLSPVFGKIDTAEMVEFMIRYQMKDVRLQLQMHKYIWDPQKRGV